MSADARFNTGFPGHPKTKKLKRKLGGDGCWSMVCLILWAAHNRPTGDLSAMPDDDIELAADWGGEEGALLITLKAVGFLDGQSGSYQIHDWLDHQPWVAGADLRSAKARWNAVKRHHGEKEADRQVPEWAEVRSATSNAVSTPASNATSTKNGATSNAPSPYPSPSPSPSPSEKLSTTSQGTPAASPGGNQLTLVAVDGKKVSRQSADEVVDLVLRLYHELLPACRKVAVKNPKLRKRILDSDKLASATIREQGLKVDRAFFWEAFFGECQDDAWLRGELPNPKNATWKQNLDVLLKEERFAEIVNRALANPRSDSGEAAA